MIEEQALQQTALEALAMASAMGATQAEVGVLTAVGLNVTVRKGNVDVLEFNRDKTVGITVYCGQRKGSASTTDWQPASLRSAVEMAVTLATLTEPDPYAGLAEANEMARDKRDLDLCHPWKLDPQEAIALAKTCEDSAFAADHRIKNSEGASVSTLQQYRVYANSHGFMGAYPSTRHSLSCTVIAEDAQGGMERDHDYTIARRPEGLISPLQIGERAAINAVKRLNARKIPTQKVPVLYHAKGASSLWGHFLAAISGGRLFRNTSFLQDALGTRCFPDYIHLEERPHLPGGLASTMFDDDGVATTGKHFVRAGVVENYVLSAYSARKLGLANTGNAGGTHNVKVATTGETLEALLKKMDRGLLVTELMGQGVNLVTGDYSRGVSGFWVEGGEIQYPVHEITVAGQLKDLFLHCVAVGNDIDYRRSIETGSVLLEEMTVGGG